MSISMYQASVPVFIHTLTRLSAILDKGAAYTEQKKFDPNILVNARLAPDMFPLSKQVQIASDIVKGGAARLAEIEIPNYSDTEASFPELKERIDRTIAFIQGIKPEKIDGSEERTVTLKMRNQEKTFKGLVYLQSFVIPNLYFHTTTAYAILRHNGVELGKNDFLGNS